MLRLLPIIITICWAVPSIDASLQYRNDTIADFRNCTITRLTSEYEEKTSQVTQTESRTLHRYPLLSCTGTNIADLNLATLPSDIAEMLFESDILPVFSLKKLRRFPNLTSLQLRGDNIRGLINANTHLNVTDHVGIRRLAMTNCNLESVPASFLRHFPQLSDLILTHNNLTEIDASDFRDLKNVKSLHLGHNPIKTLTTGWLQNLPALATLNLRAAQLTNVPKDLNQAKYIEYLDLSDNDLETLDKDGFEGCSRLTTLLLSNNQIRTIHQNAFEGAVSLHYIDLTANYIQRIPVNIFKQLPSDGLTVNIWENRIHCDGQMRWLAVWLQELKKIGSYPDIRLKCINPARLYGKRLSELSPDDFISEDEAPYEECVNRVGGETTTTALPTTVIRSSSARSTPPVTSTTKTTLNPSTEGKSTSEVKAAFDENCPSKCECHFNDGYKGRGGLPYPIVDCSGTKPDLPKNISTATKTLLFSANELKILDLTPLKLLQNLRHLHFDNNAITSITCSARSCVLNGLLQLSLANNNLGRISRDMMLNFPKITVLQLHNNQLKEIPRDTFQSNMFLEDLNLGPNPLLKPLDGALFRGLSLKKLSLRGLSLRVLPLCVENQAKLEVLDLSDNEISRFSLNAFDGCNSLAELYLENNNITFLLPGAFSRMPALVRVDLSENHLTTVNESAFFGVSSTLRHIELWENPLRCDCKLLWLKDWYIQLTKDDPMAELHFRCSQPAHVRGLTSGRIGEIDFTCNHDNVDYKPMECRPVEPGKDHLRASKIYSGRDMAIAVCLTVFTTLCLLALLKCAASRYRRPTMAIANGVISFRKESRDSTPLLTFDNI